MKPPPRPVWVMRLRYRRVPCASEPCRLTSPRCPLSRPPRVHGNDMTRRPYLAVRARPAPRSYRPGTVTLVSAQEAANRSGAQQVSAVHCSPRGLSDRRQQTATDSPLDRTRRAFCDQVECRSRIARCLAIALAAPYLCLSSGQGAAAVGRVRVGGCGGARGRPALSRSAIRAGPGDMMVDGVFRLGDAVRPLCL
jgi:hypothetical protein